MEIPTISESSPPNPSYRSLESAIKVVIFDLFQTLVLEFDASRPSHTEVAQTFFFSSHNLLFFCRIMQPFSLNARHYILI